jgi:hypothetical protein
LRVALRGVRSRQRRSRAAGCVCGAVPFDTLKLARRLESAGFPQRQAGDTAEALAEAMSGAPLATDADIASIRTEIVTLGVGLGRRSPLCTPSLERKSLPRGRS